MAPSVAAPGTFPAPNGQGVASIEWPLGADLTETGTRCTAETPSGFSRWRPLMPCRDACEWQSG